MSSGHLAQHFVTGESGPPVHGTLMRSRVVHLSLGFTPAAKGSHLSSGGGGQSPLLTFTWTEVLPPGTVFLVLTAREGSTGPCWFYR